MENVSGSKEITATVLYRLVLVSGAGWNAQQVSVRKVKNDSSCVNLFQKDDVS
jgi:hypothetical protein